MVVPVYVSHQDAPNKEVLVYALLDTQSDTTFIQEDIQAELGIEGQDVTLSLSTMSTKGQMVPSKRIRGLRVRKFNGVVGAPVNLPPCYSRPSIPANKSHVPTPAMATKWPHLHRIAKDIPPLMDCKVGLLIGYDCPSALAPREVIPPEGPDQPFGQRTDLGWGIVGIIDQHEVDCKSDAIGINHRVMTVQTPSLPSTSKTAHTVQFAVRNSVKEVASISFSFLFLFLVCLFLFCFFFFTITCDLNETLNRQEKYTSIPVWRKYIGIYITSKSNKTTPPQHTHTHTLPQLDETIYI